METRFIEILVTEAKGALACDNHGSRQKQISLLGQAFGMSSPSFSLPTEQYEKELERRTILGMNATCDIYCGSEFEWNKEHQNSTWQFSESTDTLPESFHVYLEFTETDLIFLWNHFNSRLHDVDLKISFKIEGADIRTLLKGKVVSYRISTNIYSNTKDSKLHTNETQPTQQSWLSKFLTSLVRG
jgi:hypothetical protein